MRARVVEIDSVLQERGLVKMAGIYNPWLKSIRGILLFAGIIMIIISVLVLLAMKGIITVSYDERLAENWLALLLQGLGLSGGMVFWKLCDSKRLYRKLLTEERARMEGDPDYYQSVLNECIDGFFKDALSFVGDRRSKVELAKQMLQKAFDEVSALENESEQKLVERLHQLSENLVSFENEVARKEEELKIAQERVRQAVLIVSVLRRERHVSGLIEEESPVLSETSFEIEDLRDEAVKHIGGEVDLSVDEIVGNIETVRKALANA